VTKASGGQGRSGGAWGDGRHLVFLFSYSGLERGPFSATSARQAELKLISSLYKDHPTHIQLPPSRKAPRRLLEYPWLRVKCANAIILATPSFSPRASQNTRSCSVRPRLQHTLAIYSEPLHRLSAHLQAMMTFQNVLCTAVASCLVLEDGWLQILCHGRRHRLLASAFDVICETYRFERFASTLRGEFGITHG